MATKLPDEMTETITSPNNPSIKELRKLHDRRHRDRTGLFTAEGEDMLVESMRHGFPPEQVFHDHELDPALLDDLPRGIERIRVDAGVLARASTLGSGTRVIGVWRQRRSAIADALAGGGEAAPAVYLHEVADPGNVGAVLRASYGFGATAVVVSPKTADPFGPKSVRASMGAVFAVPLAEATFEDVLGVDAGTRTTVALAPRAGTPLRDLDLSGPVVFALGAERTGLPESLLTSCEAVAHVPLVREGAESLNVAMTATLCLYESSLHRLSRSDGKP